MDLNTRIRYLNDAFEYFRCGVKLLKEFSYDTKDVEVYIWRVEKATKEANRAILAQMQKDLADNNFNDIIKGFNDEK